MENIFELINSKIKKYKFLRILNICLATMLTFVGTVSIVDLLMYLNIVFDIGYFTCLILSIVFPQLYSLIVNQVLLSKIDKKIDNTLSDIVLILDDHSNELNIDLETKYGNVKLRYENLSLKNKLKLLDYVKTGIIFDSENDEYTISSFVMGDYNENVDSANVLSNGFSKSRNMQNESGK